MLKSFVKWYVKNYMKSEYVRKDDIQAELYKARKEEAEQQDKRRLEDLAHQASLKDMEKNIKVAEFSAEIRRLEDKLDECTSNKKEQEYLEVKNRAVAKENFTQAVEMKLYMNKLLDVIAELTGRIEKIERDARDKLKMIEDRG